MQILTLLAFCKGYLRLYYALCPCKNTSGWRPSSCGGGLCCRDLRLWLCRCSKVVSPPPKAARQRPCYPLSFAKGCHSISCHHAVFSSRSFLKVECSVPQRVSTDRRLVIKENILEKIKANEEQRVQSVGIHKEIISCSTMRHL